MANINLVLLIAVIILCKINKLRIGFEFLMAESIKITIICGVVQCSLVPTFQRNFVSPATGQKNEDKGSGSSEMLVSIYQTVQRHTPEYSQY
jgi:hypothetical protein